MRVLNSFGKLNRAKRALALTMTVIWTASLLMPIIPGSQAQAAGALPVQKTLTMKGARSLAIENSDAYDSAETAVESKKANYESAVKAINLKEKSMKQFRWSPLLSFKFPETPDFSEASEFQYKPVALQYEISVAEHKLQDKTFEISEKVNNLFVEIVVLQKQIAFNESRLTTYEEGLAKNQAKLHLGQANQADVDKLEKKVESTKNKVASDRRTLEADLKKMTDMIKIDVTTGYNFQKPFVEATIDRDSLDALMKYTEDRDEGYYEACTAESSARAELNTNAKLMRNKYGGDYNRIASYVNTALNGDSINKKAFKKDYKSFLDKIDSYWNGKKRILFIKIPRLWFKGNMDGTRYIDDDPYVLYQNVLDYASAYKDKVAAKKDIDSSVEEAFNNYISVRNSYKQYQKDVDEAEANLKKDELRNRLGQLSFDEYDSEMDSFEELQNSMLDAMKLYTTTLYTFDRLTCGGISAILAGTDADMQTAVVGESYVEKNTADAQYTLKPIIQNQEFELTIIIPDDFEIEISDYELWVNNVQVGDRLPVDKKLRHLMLSFDTVSEAKIRIYNGEEFIDDCIIDPTVESGPLTITTGYDIKRRDPNQIGTYEITVNETTGLVEIKFKMDEDKEDIKSFKVLTQEGKALGGDKVIEIDKSLKYISIVKQSLDDLKIEFYDSGESVLYKARFDTANGAVLKEDDSE
ncbi:TolC family protein [Butyrivibrio sp. AE2032]|uniref:TolC family protein n=1 Tax=Butyrivibrio sp. AE2032 TaxID=1458463 RepID=UPI00054ECB08|nr:TolC family protein [Butyrivibrio sp. AE2032]